MKNKQIGLILLLIVGVLFLNQYMSISEILKGYTASETVSCITVTSWGEIGQRSCVRYASGNNIILAPSDTGQSNPAADFCRLYKNAWHIPCAGEVYEVCLNGAFDPNPDNNIVEAACHVKFGVDLDTNYTYLYGNDAIVQAFVILNDKPFAGAMVKGKILKNNIIYSESVGYTDANGMVNLIFPRVEAIGVNNITIESTYAGETKSASSDIYFGGETIVFTPTTYSYIQYNAKPVEFIVDVKDIKGKYITPTMGTISVISTMSNSNIIDSQVTYLGNGQYKIISDVSGSGIYTGKIKLSYQGVDFESKGIQIDVRDTALEIDTSGIKPTAFLNTIETLRFITTSSIGGTIEPDDINIDVQYPDGFTTKKMIKSDLYGIGNGTYEFNFTFNQLEKYTFNIYADKVGYTRGRSTISVAVSSIEEEFNYIGFILSNAGLIFVVFVLSMFVYYRSKKK